MSDTFSHYSVMLSEAVNGLAIKPDGIYVDGTMGGCGHSKVIAQKCKMLVAIDKDEDAIKVASDRLNFDNVKIVRDDFHNIKNILSSLDIDGVDGVLLDLGVSSYQLDTPERGFSYRYDAPLDMRMDKTAPLSAYDIVNGYEPKKLEKIIFDYGEEKFARQIVRKITEVREKSPIKTTFELVEIIKSAMPPKERRREKHPAKRTFQAIRIAVNDELDGLSKTIRDICDCLNPGGRISIISFHSLEDRIVKTTFADLANGCTCPKDFPVCVCGNKPKLKVITRKPILPSEKELSENSRSQSAKLRISEKI